MSIKTPRIKFVFDRKKKASKTTNGAVEIEVYYNGVQYRVATGVCVRSGEFKGSSVVRRMDAVSLNASLSAIQVRVYDYAVNQQKAGISVLNKEELRKLVTGYEAAGSRIDLFEWLEERINARPIRQSTRRQHIVMMKALKDSGLFKTFNDLTTPNIKAWDDMLHKKVSCQSSVHGYHKRLKPYIAEAIQFGLLKESPYVSLKIKRSSGTPRKKYLTDEEREKIERLELNGGEARSRDLFIFCCYTGLAFSDAIKITKDDIFTENGQMYLEDNRQKSGSHYKIKLLPKAVEILKRYDFNMNLITNQKCNVYLKIIAVKAGLKFNLTSHMGRHTFATWALRKGVRKEIVSKMLAHSDIATTQVYAKILQEDVDSGYDTLMKSMVSEPTRQSTEELTEQQTPPKKKRGRPKKNP